MTGKIKTYSIAKGSRVVSVRWQDLQASLAFCTVTKVNTSSIYLDDVKLERSQFERLGFEKDIQEAIYHAYGYLFNLREHQLREHLSKSIGGLSICCDFESDYIRDKEGEITKDILSIQSTRRLRLVAISRLQRLEAKLLKRKILKSTF